MRLRKAIESFNKFYKTKKRFVAARGQWGGSPKLGLDAHDLREAAKKAGMTVEEYLRSMGA